MISLLERMKYGPTFATDSDRICFGEDSHRSLNAAQPITNEPAAPVSRDLSSQRSRRHPSLLERRRHVDVFVEYDADTVKVHSHASDSELPPSMTRGDRSFF